MNKHLRCFVLDDEENNVTLLTSMLSIHCPELDIIGSETDALIGLKLIKQIQPELIFLDIQMPGLNGFQLLKKLEPVSFEVIFVTAFTEYAIKAFDYHAIGYLTKPIDIEKLKKTVHVAQERIAQKDTTSSIFSLLEKQISSKQETKIPLSTVNGLTFVDEEEIIYCESNGNYTKFFLKDGKDILVSKPIGDYERSLPQGSFVRIHDKHIINLKYVTQYVNGRGGEIKLTRGVTLPVSANRKDSLTTRFDRWMNK